MSANEEPKGILETLGVTGKMLLSISDENDDLDDSLVRYRDDFCAYTVASGVRYRKHGMLAEIVARTSVLLYDLPELAVHCDTACADSAGHIFFYVGFYKRLLEDKAKGLDSLEYLFAHEADHIRRMHMTRMNQFPRSVSNRAQDVVINIRNAETIVAARLDASGIQFDRDSSSFLSAMKDWYDRHKGSIVETGMAGNYADYLLWRNASEEEVASHLAARGAKEAEKKSISFSAIMSAAARVIEQVEASVTSGVLPTGAAMPSKAGNMSPSQLQDLALEVERIGLTKASSAQVTDSEIETAANALSAIKGHPCVEALNELFASQKSPLGPTGDAYIDGIQPDGRLLLAEQALRSAIAPKQAGGKQSESGIKLTDLDRAPNQKPGQQGQQAQGQGQQAQGQGQQAQGQGQQAQGQGQQAQGQGQQAQGQGQQAQGQGQQAQGQGQQAQGQGQQAQGQGQQAQGQGQQAQGQGQQAQGQGQQAQGQGQQAQGQGAAPAHGVIQGALSATVNHDCDNHVMSAEALAQILHDAGVAKSSLEKLGLSQLGELRRQVVGCKDQMSKALTASIESMRDARRAGKIMPGAHCVDEAYAELKDLNRPTMTWEVLTKKMIAECGRGIAYDYMEASTIFNTTHSDMGYAHASDVPYDGSYIPGRQTKPLLGALIDSSGSVDDGMLRSFVQVTMDAVGRRGRHTAPDVLFAFADTVVRGDATLLTEKNIKQVEKSVVAAGRGGTNMLAALENMFQTVSPKNLKSKVKGRQLDALFYLTDLGDRPPTKQQILNCAKKHGLKKVPKIVFLATNLSIDKHFEAQVKDYASVVYYDPMQTKQRLRLNLDAQEHSAEAKAKVRAG